VIASCYCCAWWTPAESRFRIDKKPGNPSSSHRNYWTYRSSSIHQFEGNLNYGEPVCNFLIAGVLNCNHVYTRKIGMGYGGLRKWNRSRLGTTPARDVYFGFSAWFSRRKNSAKSRMFCTPKLIPLTSVMEIRISVHQTWFLIKNFIINHVCFFVFKLRPRQFK
jgi:hypothetical protein